MGVVECAKHELLQPFNVLYEKEGEQKQLPPGAFGRRRRENGAK